MKIPQTVVLASILAVVPLHAQRAGASDRNFNGMVAYSYLTKQTLIGPRAPGLPGHNRCLAFLHDELRKYADVDLSIGEESPSHISLCPCCQHLRCREICVDHHAWG